MSNDRHLEIDNGTMGSLFRRATLAALGLDALDDVSEQSFEVIDRADAFAERVLGGMRGIMPKSGTTEVGAHTTALVDHIFENMVGLNGPSSATDLGDWQYWLDATLLMLFDEDEEALESGLIDRGTASSVKSTRKSQLKATPEAIRERIAALKKSGMSPSMIQGMPQAQKRELIAKLQKTSKPSAETLAKAMQETLLTADKSVSFDTVFAQNSRQIMASHVAEKASALTGMVKASEAGGHTAEMVRRWTESVNQFQRNTGSDMASMREMFSSLDSLEKAGAITREQSTELRRTCQKYARRVLAEEVTHDVSMIAGRFEQMAGAMTSSKSPKLNSQRALTISASTKYAESVESLKRSFASLSEKLDTFNASVSEHILTAGDSAATMRWQRSSERFVRMQGVSDDVDRVLLRDIIESAAALGNAGVVSQDVVDSIVKSSAAQQILSQQSASGNVEFARMLNADKLNVTFANDGRSILAAPGVINHLAERVERSVETLVSEMTSMRADGLSSISPMRMSEFVSSIRQLASEGKSVIHDPMSIVRASSVIESICEKLDEFAESTASGIVTHGYDELTSESGVFVSTDEKSSDIVGHTYKSSQESVKALRAMLAEANKQTLAQARELMNTKAQAKAADEIREQVLKGIESANNVQALAEAQKLLESHLDSGEREALKRAVESARRSEIHLESVARQTRLIEQAAHLSSQLRQSVETGTGITAKPVMMDNAHIQPSYFASLGETLASYAKIRDEYRSIVPSVGQNIANANNSRLTRMLSTIKPIASEDAEEMALPVLSQNETTILGYDEIVPSSMEWIRQQSNQYPSNDRMSDLTSILGVSKAIETHAASAASGNPGSVSALGQAISKIANQPMNTGHETFISYGINAEGDRVKVSVGLGASKASSSQGYALRQDMGKTYIPESARQSQGTADRVGASIEMSKLHDGMLISGAKEFVPVMAGANTNEALNISEEDRTMIGKASSNAAQSREAILSIAGRLGLWSDQAQKGGERMQLRAGGVDFDMTSNAFVEMLAKPVMERAAYSAPSLMNAQNVLFSGYAALINQQSDHRTLQSLRHAYMKSLAQAGNKSAHGDLGFNTQTFSSMMGTQPDSLQIRHYSAANEDERAWLSSDNRQAAASSQESVSDAVMARTAQVESASASTTDFAWVSNALNAQFNASRNAVNTRIQHDETEHQILSKIDSMLDYVENMSQRDVGVFSSDETVRVLLEALPEAGKLGNKGLPKWRQKDTAASRAAEARELRNALASIGASPIQGTQPYANKQYVSPNLMDRPAAAPLFSGGSDGGSVPSASANASNLSNSMLNSKSIPQEDLEVLAEDVFERIIESFREELQRRRTE